MSKKLSSSQIRKLGERLRKNLVISDEDLKELANFRANHVDPLTNVFKELRELLVKENVRFEYSGRIKNTATIIEKLRRRDKGTGGRANLHSIQDIAGIRVVLSNSDLSTQDHLVNVIRDSNMFANVSIDDRREKPSHGYRAAHVIGQYCGVWVEIQIRTKLQHYWAEFFEAFADFVGRQIRYGDKPNVERWETKNGSEYITVEVIDQLEQLSGCIHDAEHGRKEDDVKAVLADFKAYKGLIYDSNPNVFYTMFNRVFKRPPKEIKPDLWYLVIYNRKTRQGEKWMTLSGEKLQDEWKGNELKYRNKQDIEIVVLKSQSLESLRETHERYFSPEPGIPPED